jgi:hypothetical protein
VTRLRGNAPAGFGPPVPKVPGALSRPAPWAAALVCVLAGVLALSGCAAKMPKPTPASLDVDAVRQVLDGMSEGLKARDVTALASQWDPSVREDARARIRAALDAWRGASGAVEVRMTPVAVRAEGQRRLARVAWKGTFGRRKADGIFELELSAGDPPAILAVRGADPVQGPAAAAPPAPGDLEGPAP